MFLINWTYILFMLPALLFTMIASSLVNSTFQRYSKQNSQFNISGAEAARKVLDAHGLSHIRIEKVRGHLSDHYDPKNEVIRLSESVYDSSSIAAIGVACHEVGHAIQYDKHYIPIKIRNAIIPITNIGSRLSMPLILIGILFSLFGEGFSIIAYIGVFLFGFCVLFQLITLPVEFNASSRAIKNIRNYGILDESEISGAKSVLKAAAMTYVAALAVALSQFLYLFTIVSRSNRRR